MKKSIIAWLVFFGGFGFMLLVDYFLRIQDGNIKSGGIPELLFFTTIIALSLLAIWQLYMASIAIKSLWKQLLVLGVQVGIAFILYAFLSLFYVVGVGIDSM